MNDYEQWVRWLPEQGLSDSYFIKSICNDEESGLQIILYETKDIVNQVYITYDSGVFAYRETYETYTHDRMLQACKRQSRELFFGTNFFKVNNSEYIKWLSKQSGGLSEYDPVEHFAIFTEDSLVEILANYEPEIKLLSDQK